MYQQVEVIVVGSGHFPLDMLRYDSCFPASESDAYLIERTFNEYGYWRIRVAKRVSKAYKSWREHWSVPRWSSFNASLEDARFNRVLHSFETIADRKKKKDQADQVMISSDTGPIWVKTGSTSKSPTDPTLGQ